MSSGDTQLESTTQNGRWPARFVSVVLFIGIAVLAMLLTIAASEVSALHSELGQLRAEAGHLDIADPQKIYAVRIPTTDSYEWAWRVYLPPNHAYQHFHYQGRMSDPTTQPDADFSKIRRAGSGGSGSIQSGEYVMRIKLEENADGQWVTKVITGTGWGSMGQKPRTDWLAKRDWQEFSDVPLGKQREFSADANVEFLRLRNESAVDANDPARKAESLFFWISNQSTVRQ